MHPCPRLVNPVTSSASSASIVTGSAVRTFIVVSVMIFSPFVLHTNSCRFLIFSLDVSVAVRHRRYVT